MATNNPGPHFSFISILAVIAAVLSFTASPGVAFLMAIVAIVLGVIGFLIAFLPNVRGGIVSFISIGAGALGIVIALFRIIFHSTNQPY